MTVGAVNDRLSFPKSKNSGPSQRPLQFAPAGLVDRRFSAPCADLGADTLQQLRLILQEFPEFPRIGVIDLPNKFPVRGFDQFE